MCQCAVGDPTDRPADRVTLILSENYVTFATYFTGFPHDGPPSLNEICIRRVKLAVLQNMLCAVLILIVIINYY
jgi:hypothetical protein